MIPPKTIRTTLLIIGMKDNRCREVIADALESIPGVSQVDVNLIRARAVVLHDSTCGAEDFVRAVLRGGYEVVVQSG